MYSDGDKCFQCQETGHMACYCPHIRCFDCNNYGHITADCPDKKSRHDRSMSQSHNCTSITTMTIGVGTDSVDLDCTHITLDIGVTVAMILTEVALDPFTGPHITAHCTTEAPAHTAATETHHTTDPHHAEISLEMTVDPEHTNPPNTITEPHKDHLPVHNQSPWSPRIGTTSRLQLMTHHQNIISLMNRTVIQRMV